MTLPGAPAASIQRKADIGEVTDPLEREADDVADAVTRGDASAPAVGAASAGAGTLQRKCAGCEEEQEGRVQRKRSPGASATGSASHAGAAVPASASALTRGSAGQPLDRSTRTFFEARLGADLDGVRVHTGAQAAESAADLSAHAYTLRDHIVFGQDRYQPSTKEGRRLLAHELTHVLQQRASGPAVQREADGACPGAEKQAMITQAMARAREMNTLAQTLLPDKQRRAAQTDILGKYGLHGRAKGESLTMSALSGQRNAEGYVANYARAQPLLDRESGASCAPAASCKGDPITYDGTFHVCPAWFSLPAESSATTSRVGSLLRAVYTCMLGQRMKDEKMDPGDAEHISGVSELMTGVTTELGEMGGGGGITFDDALREAATVLQGKFGLAGGLGPGVDPKDGYDPRDFSEDPGSRGVLVAKTEPWLAMSNMVKNARSDIPKPGGGGTTRWSFDCFEFVILTRIYAYFRTMPRAQFNERFRPLTLGFNADFAGRTGLAWGELIQATKPGEKPFKLGPMESSTRNGQMTFEQPKIPEGKSWAELVRDAPIGTQIIWSNKDAAAKCGKDASLSFCAFENENVTKVGQDEYSAYPFGIKSEKYILEAMAAAPFDNDFSKVPAGYIAKNIYISAMRYPKP